MVDWSGLLYARPSFMEGVARLFDLGGTLNEYNRSTTPEEADLLALRSDWEALGQDFRTVITTADLEAMADHVSASEAQV